MQPTSGSSCVGKCTAAAALVLLLLPLCSQAEGVNVTWSQTTDDVVVKVPVDSSVRGKSVK